METQGEQHYTIGTCPECSRCKQPMFNEEGVCKCRHCKKTVPITDVQEYKS